MASDAWTKIDEALGMIRNEYRSDLESLAQDIKSALADEIADREGLLERIHETIDANQWIIYTRRAEILLLVTENADAYEEHFGTSDGPVKVEARAFCAMERDLYDALEAEDVDVNDPWTCAHCDTKHESRDDAQECCRGTCRHEECDADVWGDATHCSEHAPVVALTDSRE